MSYFTFNGSPGSDYISSFDLNQTNPGHNGYIVYGLSGNDTIRLSIVGRLGIDAAIGGSGDDFFYSYAFNSEYAGNVFGGGYGNDRVYFSASLTPETTVDGKPNFIRKSTWETEIKLSASDGTVLTAVFWDDIERIEFGATGEAFLTEDIANNRIQAVNWSEEYARTFNGNEDWYLRGLNTYKSYYGYDYSDNYIGTIENGQEKVLEGSASAGDDYELYFSVSGNEKVYAYFEFSDFTDDLDFELLKRSSEGRYIKVSSSNLVGNADEAFFKALSNGTYKLRASFYENLDDSNSATSFKLNINTNSFLQNSILPNDPYFDQQWSLFNTGQADGDDNEDIFAPEAWKIQNKSPDIIVAVIDSGVRLDHEDLKNNLWVNSGEIADNGIDDDGNGYIDDIHGWNFEGGKNWWIPQHHGTHVAGLIAAEGNNGRGISGVTWDAQLMCLDVMNQEPRSKTTYDDLVEAIYYAANNGANVINMSLGGLILNTSMAAFKHNYTGLYYDLYNALNYAVDKGCVVVCAAGNETKSTERHSSIPASFSSLIPGVISVAAVGNTGDITQYSNYSESVTIAAPGGDERSEYGSKMVSTWHEHSSSYESISGTSMAAPLVAGAAALIMQKNRSLSPAEVEEVLTASATKSKDLQSLVQDGNFLDLEMALVYASTYDSDSTDLITGNISKDYVYRLRNMNSGRYLFSSNNDEIDLITNWGWVNEGIAYASPTKPTASVHRFQTSGGVGHFYTANEQEKNIVIESTDFLYEGIAFDVYSVYNYPSHAIPVIRYLGVTGIHLYSTSTIEQNILDESSDWLREGIAWYADPAI